MSSIWACLTYSGSNAAKSTLQVRIFHPLSSACQLTCFAALPWLCCIVSALFTASSCFIGPTAAVWLQDCQSWARKKTGHIHISLSRCRCSYHHSISPTILEYPRFGSFSSVKEASKLKLIWWCEAVTLIWLEDQLFVSLVEQLTLYLWVHLCY